ncbi:uncharacterized protein LOC113303472 [Papaver somniferum]|uniref:uncharacterized protein LOC113303472 n=1 Tax=Papaver somniferum TaxID=3469 RepID=UPI000E6F782B|nr:uncharacterized protein LOC113303472 [Papaver somniferum]
MTKGVGDTNIGKEDLFKRILVFLMAFRNVNELMLSSDFLQPDSEDDVEVVLSGSCILSHLKYIEMREVKGCNNELIFLEFVLKKCLSFGGNGFVFLRRWELTLNEYKRRT